MNQLPHELDLDTIIESFADACRRGEKPSVDLWVNRFPTLADRLRALLPSVLMLEAAPRDTAAENGVRTRGASMQPERVGDFRIVREVGRGGMGVVLEAIEEPLGRRVALKLLPGVQIESMMRARFEREAAVTSRLDHPGICPVYRAGIHEGVPFLAMRFLEGETLAHRLGRQREKGTPPRTREEIATVLGWIEEVARALHYAHETGIVHRDVKPQNIMLDLGGRPILLDFGLARDSSENASLTGTGGVCGTPGYLAPEVLQGDGSGRAKSIDIYGLGVVLFECLTLQRPFEAPTLSALYYAILHEPTPDAPRLNPSINRDAQAVLSTALEKNPSLRYGSAAALADDLRALALGRPVSVKPPSPLGRVSRWARREPMKATFVATVLVLFLTLSGLLGYLAAKRPEIRRAEEVERSERLQAALERGYIVLGQPGGVDGSASAFSAALGLDPNCVEAHVGMALNLLYALRPAEALDLLDRRPDLFASYPTLGLIRAAALRHLGRSEDASQIEGSIPPPVADTDWFICGVIALDEGQRGNRAAFQRAKDQLQRALGLCSYAKPFYYGVLGQAAMYCGDRELALKTSSEIVSLWPHSDRSWVWRAIALQTMDPGAAEEACRKALELDPRWVRTRELLSELVNVAGRHDEGLAIAQALVESKPDCQWTKANYSYWRGAAAWKLGDREGALRCYQDAVRLFPNNARNWVGVGSVQRHLGHYSEAEASFQCAVDRDPRSASAQEGLGATRLHLGNAEGALEPLSIATKLDPKRCAAFHNLGSALGRLGRWEEVRAPLRAAFRLDAANEKSWLKYEQILVTLGRLDELVDAARERASLLPSDSVAAMSVGAALLRLGRLDEAEAALRRTLEGNPNLAEAHLHLGEVLRQSGNFEEALRSARRGLECRDATAKWQNPYPNLVAQCEALLRFDAAVRRVELNDTAAIPTGRVLQFAWVALLIGKAELSWRICQDAIENPDLETVAGLPSIAEISALAAMQLAHQGSSPDSDLKVDPANLRQHAFQHYRSLLGSDRLPDGEQPVAEVRIRWLRLLHDSRLDIVRDRDQLQALPETERRDWALLWQDARRFLADP